MVNEYEIKKQICEIGKRIYDKGMVAANDGNISVKLNDNEFLCTPTGVSKGFMTPEYICKVDRDGRSKSTDPDLIITPSGVDAKGQKSYDISFGARTVESLQNADSAIQTINLFGTDIRKAENNAWLGCGNAGSRKKCIPE